MVKHDDALLGSIAAIRLDGDDDILRVVDKINQALARVNLKLVDDDQVHDGFIVLTLENHSAVSDFISKGRAAGHDALGIANDPEALLPFSKSNVPFEARECCAQPWKRWDGRCGNCGKL